MVPVTDLRLHNPSRKLIAATYGRSMYTLDLNDLFVSIPQQQVTELSAISVFPNPVTEYSSVSFFSIENAGAEMEIYDLTGRIIS